MSKYTLLCSSWQTRNLFSHHSHAAERSCQLRALLSDKHHLVSWISFRLRRWHARVGKKKTRTTINGSLKRFAKKSPSGAFYAKQKTGLKVLSVATGACFKFAQLFILTAVLWHAVNTAGVHAIGPRLQATKVLKKTLIPCRNENYLMRDLVWSENSKLRY